MPELQHHLIPRSKGFTASLPFLKNKCPGLYDIQLAFKADDKYEPTVANLLHGHSVNGYMHVRRIDMKSIPDGEDEAAEWLQNLFREKDELQESFHKHGDFFTGSRFKKVEPVLQKPSLATLLNTVIWSIVTLTPMLYYLVRLLFSGELLYFSIGVAIITICKLILSRFFVYVYRNSFANNFPTISVYLLMSKTIGMSKIDKGSSYGSVQNGKSKSQ